MTPSLKRIAFVGGFSPRRCGIATFTHDLHQAVSAANPAAEVWVAAVTDRDQRYEYPPEVRFQIEEGNPDSYRKAAKFLNFSAPDVLCVQHEFGIYGGPAGSHLLTLLREVKVPVVTTLHTILAAPSTDQMRVMEELIRGSSRLVVMAARGAEILQEVYRVDPSKIEVIPHGIPDVPFRESAEAKQQLGFAGRTVLLTFGLLGPGKGIEYAIEAMPAIVAQDPAALYVILGATHPHLVTREGERYRRGLEQLARDRGVGEHVVFEDRFVSEEDLGRFIAAADIYLTPYPNEAQITSGTLARAFGAGKAVVSTPYWHAAELLGNGAGVLVPPRDAAGIAAGVCQVLRDPAATRVMRQQAYADGRAMIWPAVAQRYLDCCGRAKSRAGSLAAFPGQKSHGIPTLRLEHLQRLSDGTGIFQHAIYDVPNYDEGYCVDDNARAFLLCVLADESAGVAPRDDLLKLSTTYLAFVAASFNRDLGRFRNFMSHDRAWLEEAGSEDSHGRALWALGTGAARARGDGHRALCLQLFEAGLPAVESFTSPRAWAATLLGLHAYLKVFRGDLRMHRMRRALCERLLAVFKRSATRDWPWFERSLAYDNARLSQALIASGSSMPHPEALEVGLSSLRWLADVQTAKAGHFRPIGSEGFYRRHGTRAEFDQQPIEAQATVSACLEAWRVTSLPAWKAEAQKALDWFLGRNDLGLPLFDARTGGCCDGLHQDRLNANQGAESTLAFCFSLVEMQLAEAAAAAQPMKQTA